jgi:hypothetical protein
MLGLIIQRENSGSDSFGTGRANLSKSGGQSPPSLRLNAWGGARNSASRQSDSISLIKALELVEATQQAMAIGLPFNRHLTVHWEKARLTDADAANATGRLLKLILDWVRKRGGEFAYAWVRENGDRKGSHTHILLHLPRGLALRLTRRWYGRVTGWRGRVPKGAVKSVCIGDHAHSAFSGGEWYQADLASVLAYLLKGVETRSAAALDLDRYADGGAITGKRVSISSSLARGESNRLTRKQRTPAGGCSVINRNISELGKPPCG